MSDSQQPKPAVPRFEVPDLELEPGPRSQRTAHTPAAHTPAAHTPAAQGRGYSAPNLFDDDALGAGGPTIDLGLDNGAGGAAHFGANAGFDPQGDFELEATAIPGLSLEHEAATLPLGSPMPSARGAAATEGWRTGQQPERERLLIDPLELALLANYGDAPKSIHLAPLYAFRVFSRQRELKRALVPLEAERVRAESERESALASLAQVVRPEAEKIEQFRRLFATLIEVEQLASQRGQALSSVNAAVAGQSATIDAELAALGERVAAEQALEHDALRVHDDREAVAKRAAAKLQRVHIEMRALTQVAEQKLGPQGGKIPEREASELSALERRAEAVQPEVTQANAELERAKGELDRTRARLEMLRQSERQTLRKKQALAQHFQKELQVRSQGLNESEATQRARLADLGRAVLAAPGSLVIDDGALARVKIASQRADAVLMRCEMHLRALDTYDRERVTRGVRLAVTLFALFVLLLVLKLAL